MWSRMGLAICHVNMEDEIAADADAERLVTKFADNGNLGQAVEQIVHEYHLREQYDKADRLLGQAIAKQAGANLGPLGKASVVRMYIRAGDDEAAETVYSEIMAEYGDHPSLSQAVRAGCRGIPRSGPWRECRRSQ